MLWLVMNDFRRPRASCPLSTVQVAQRGARLMSLNIFFGLVRLLVPLAMLQTPRSTYTCPAHSPASGLQGSVFVVGLSWLVIPALGWRWLLVFSVLPAILMLPLIRGMSACSAAFIQQHFLPLPCSSETGWPFQACRSRRASTSHTVTFRARWTR